MNNDISIKVTNINGEYHARLYKKDGTLHSEAACNEKQDVQYICYQLCRWYDKMVGDSNHAWKSRDREHAYPIGKWWNVSVEKE